MKKNNFMTKYFLFVFCFLFCFINSKHVFCAEFNLDSQIKSALLMESSTGKILFEKNSHEKLAPASVTKVMTILLIYEAIKQNKISPDDLVTISEHAASMGGSQIFLEPDEQQPVKDLLKAIIIASANDGAVAMAEHIAGSEEAFVKLMNNRASELEMHDTNFINACGLDIDGHVTSAHDIALMTRELINNFPEIFKISTTWMDNITHKTRRGESEFGLTNTNKLIKTYTGITGLKTGSTSQAGFCVSATAQRDNMNLIAVIMGAPDSKMRFNTAARLLDYGYLNYAIISGEPAGTVKGSVKVCKGEKDEVNIAVKEQINILVAKSNKSKIESHLENPVNLKAPISKNTKAAEIVYCINDKEVARGDLVTVESVNRASILQIIKKIFSKLF